MRRLALLLLATVAQAAVLLDQTAELKQDSPKLETGEFFAVYTAEVEAGQLLTVSCESDAFDAYVVVNTSDERHFVNDDAEGRNAKVNALTLASGKVVFVATSSKPGELGQFRIRAVAQPLEGGLANLKSTFRKEGELQTTDAKLKGGEYNDIYDLKLPPGLVCRARLAGEGFDPYLLVKLPDGTQVEADDTQGTDAEVVFITAGEGKTGFMATSSRAGEVGHYLVEVQTAPLSADRPDPKPLLQEQGQFRSDSRRLQSGEYAEVYKFKGRQGQSFNVRLSPTGFAGYLIVKLPGEQPQVEVQAAQGEPVVAAVTLQADGVVQVIVTTASKGEVGSYQLTVLPGANTPTPPTTPPAGAGGLPPAASLEPFRPGPTLPALKPNPQVLQQPGILGRTLQRMKYVSIVFSGVHRWQGNRFETKGRELRDVDASGPRYERFECYPRRYDGCPPLEWAGNTFHVYHETHQKGELYCYEAGGTVAPSGDRLERLLVRTYVQQVAAADADQPTGKLRWRTWANYTLTDLPFNARHWFGGTAAYTFAEAFESLSGRGGTVEQSGICYDSEGPDTRDHALEIRYLEQRPHYDSEPFIDPEHIRWREYQGTDWLNQDTTPKLLVRFYNQ